MRLRLCAIGVLLLAEFAAYAVLLPSSLPRHSLWLEIVATALFVPAVSLLSRTRLSPRRMAALIIGAGIAFQAVALLTPPTSSDDDYRYIWDAKVQLSGADPYRYAPVAPELQHLRDGFFFPQRAHCPWPVPDGCSAINRPTVRTIYPPVAEGAFTLIRLGSLGGKGNHLPLQLAAALGSIAVAWLLYRRRLARDRPLWTVALWAWCPLTVVEFGNNAHIDWLAIMFAVLALTSQAARRSGVFAGAAIATKLYPALILPALLRRRPLAVIAAAAGTVAISYVPHVAAVGTKVLGYLPDYLRDEHYTSGQRFLLLEPALPHVLATAVAVLALVGTAAWVARRTDPARPEDTAVVMVGVAMLVTTPSYSWYGGMLLALAAMSGAAVWLPVALAPSFAYLVTGAFHVSAAVPRSIYAVALGLTLSVGWARRQRDGRRVRLAGRVGPADRDVVAGVVSTEDGRHVVR